MSHLESLLAAHPGPWMLTSAQVRAIVDYDRRQRVELERLRTRVEALEAALREIAVGKIQEDVTHPLGEWFSMAGRFITIACRTLKEQT